MGTHDSPCVHSRHMGRLAYHSMVKIKVGHRDIGVNGLDPKEAKDQGLYGYYQEGQIFIDKSLDPPEQARIFLHELLHALFDIWQIKGSRFTQEGVCKALDKPLAALFRDNPELSQTLDAALNQKISLV